MKLLAFIILSNILFLSYQLPYADQLCLANSLIVGKNDTSQLMIWSCKVCDSSNKPQFTYVIEDTGKDIKCLISIYEYFIILAFRYTNTVQNVWQDILYPLQISDQHTCKNCKVQKAYHTMWEAIKKKVISNLIFVKSITGLETLYITGISLGGGLSVISYIDINHANIFDKVKVTTFGAPKVGNKNWADYFDLITEKKTRRFYVSGDPVMNFPKCLTPFCSYKHTGVLIMCYEDKKLCIQESPTIQGYNQNYSLFFNLKSLVRQISSSKSYFQNIQSISDHTQGYPKIYNNTLEMKFQL